MISLDRLLCFVPLIGHTYRKVYGLYAQVLGRRCLNCGKWRIVRPQRRSE